MAYGLSPQLRTKITISMDGEDINIKVFNPNSEEDGLARLLADVEKAEGRRVKKGCQVQAFSQSRAVAVPQTGGCNEY